MSKPAPGPDFLASPIGWGSKIEPRLDKSGGCWVWTGAKSSGGYGQIRQGGKAVYTHRVAWEAHNGPIPQGLEIDHLCRNRACANPGHLEPVTHRENVVRGLAPTTPKPPKTCLLYGQCGHPRFGANLYLTPAGARACRQCKYAKKVEWRNKRRAEGMPVS